MRHGMAPSPVRVILGPPSPLSLLIDHGETSSSVMTDFTWYETDKQIVIGSLIRNWELVLMLNYLHW